MESFQRLKGVLARLSVLAKVCPGDTLCLYYAVSEYVVSSVLLKEDKKGIQCSIFFTSRVLRGAKSRYPEVEKKALVVVCVAWRLCSYFQAHRVVVVTSDTHKKILHAPAAIGRLILWAVELSEFDIEYVPKMAIKAQVLAEVLADFAEGEGEESE